MNPQRIGNCFGGFPQLAPGTTAASIRNLSATGRAGIHNVIRGRGASRVANMGPAAGIDPPLCQQVRPRTVAMLQRPVRDPSRVPRNNVTLVAHYCLTVEALTQPMEVREDEEPHGRADG